MGRPKRAARHRSANLRTTAGTGGFLSSGMEYVHELNPEAVMRAFGQELNPESYGVVGVVVSHLATAWTRNPTRTKARLKPRFHRRGSRPIAFDTRPGPPWHHIAFSRQVSDASWQRLRQTAPHPIGEGGTKSRDQVLRATCDSSVPIPKQPGPALIVWDTPAAGRCDFIIGKAKANWRFWHRRNRFQRLAERRATILFT